MGDEVQQAVWNLDGAELYTIFEIKKDFIISLVGWDLEKAYWKARLIRMELDAKLDRGNKKKIVEDYEKREGKEKGKSEKEKIDEMMKNLEDERKTFNNSKQDDEDKGKYYLKLEAFYMELCHTMKRHGLYFREGEDMTLAVLRR